jgi:cell division septation protein DedD
MADITHDAAPVTDDGFHEIQLSGKQLVFLFMIAAVVLVATFLCGVQVGRGVRTDRSLDATTADALVTTPPPPAASTPSQPAASSGPPAAEPPAPAQDDELSYAKRLQGESAPAEKLKPQDSRPAQTAAPKAAPPAAAPPKQNAAPSSTGQPGAWVVQLVALKDRTEAAGVAKRLASKGYPAFVLDPAAGAPVIYRVQVGGFADRDHADQAARQIAREENMQGYVRSR